MYVLTADMIDADDAGTAEASSEMQPATQPVNGQYESKCTKVETFNKY
jgi:hypothetical protein